MARTLGFIIGVELKREGSDTVAIGAAILVVLFASSVLVAVSPWIVSNLERNTWAFMYAMTVVLMGCTSTVVADRGAPVP